MKSVSPQNRKVSSCRAYALDKAVAICLIVFAGGISALRGHSLSPQSSAGPSQAEIRAAFVFNFPKFAEWPRETYLDAGSPLRVCFLGAEDVHVAFQSLSVGKVVNGRPLESRAVKSGIDLHSCQVVYLESTNNSAVLDALKYAREGNALAIGTSDNFLASGGMIRLLIENNRMRFDVNVGAVGRTRIHLSSKLLALARSVVDLPAPVSK